MSSNSRSKPPVLLLFGPTASGKTELIAEIFKRGFEVISADSEQVYRGLGVGTAKPEAGLRARVAHHLLDIRDPDGQFSVGDFVKEADRLVEEIIGRGRIPLVSGGTAYYLKHFLFGLPASPPSEPGVRRAVRKELEEKGQPALYEELKAADPLSAGKISPLDTYRLTRALEVIRQSGRPLSAFALSNRPRPQYDFLLIGLRLSREEGAARIERRVEGMFASGLVEEIRSLLKKGYGPEDPGMKGIGYKEFFFMQKCGCTFTEVKALIKRHSLQYAKRQMTFFNRLPDVRWFHSSQKEEIRDCVTEFLNAPALLRASRESGALDEHPYCRS